MSLKNRILITTLLGLTFSFLVACGGGSGGFHVEPSLQSESTLPKDLKPLPRTSSAQIVKGEDPTILKEDPILHDSTTTSPEQVAVPEKESLPANTYGTVRVKLFPLLKSRPKDAYTQTKETDRLRLRHESGLRLRSLTSTSTFDKTGKEVEFQFSEKKVTIDGEVSDLEEGMALGLFPVRPEIMTEVELAVDVSRLKDLKASQPGHSYFSFRGLFLVKNRQLINYVATEDYLRSVVPSEIGEGFEIEAVKAQAIAARSYSLNAMKRARISEYREWDVDPTTQFQQYLGANSEKQLISAAVDQTAGQFMSFDGAPALAMYHASSGGKTDGVKQSNCKRLIGSSKKKCEEKAELEFPYLSGGEDPHNNGRKRLGHGVGLPQMSAQEMAKKGSEASDILKFYYPGIGFDQF